MLNKRIPINKKIQAVLGSDPNEDIGLTEAQMQRLGDAGVFDPRVDGRKFRTQPDAPPMLYDLLAKLEAIEIDLQTAREHCQKHGIKAYTAALNVVLDDMGKIIKPLARSLGRVKK